MCPCRPFLKWTVAVCRGGGGSKRDQVVMETINNLLERLPPQFHMLEISELFRRRRPTWL